MSERGRSATMIANERIKAVAAMFFNLGSALIAATAARAFFGGVDLIVLGWSLVAVALIFVGWKSLYLLETED